MCINYKLNDIGWIHSVEADKCNLIIVDRCKWTQLPYSLQNSFFSIGAGACYSEERFFRHDDAH